MGQVVAPGVHDRRAKLKDPAVRDAMRSAVERPNRDPDLGSTLPPPHWDALFVGSVGDPRAGPLAAARSPTSPRSRARPRPTP